MLRGIRYCRRVALRNTWAKHISLGLTRFLMVSLTGTKAALSAGRRERAEVLLE